MERHLDEPLPEKYVIRSPEPWRASAGRMRAIRKSRCPELFAPYDPRDLVGDPKPPDGIRLAFEELIGKPPDYLLAFHPALRRFVAWERDRRPDVGPRCYYPFSVFMEPVAGDEALPLDLNDEDHRHLAGVVGEFRLPHRHDFELLLEYASRWRNTPEELDAKMAAAEEAEALEKEARLRDYEWEGLDYNYLRIASAANGGKIYSLPGLILDGAPTTTDTRTAKHVAVAGDARGYWIVERRDHAKEAGDAVREAVQFEVRVENMLAKKRASDLLHASMAVLANRRQRTL